MEKGGAVYILTNKTKTTLYIGITNNLKRRLYEHKTHQDKKSFTYRYNLEYLIYYEVFHNIEEAIFREKQLKKYSRKNKEKLINSLNPQWKDLLNEIA